MGFHSAYKLAIHLLLVKDDKVLLLRRFNTGYEDGKYSLVAGHVEKGESIIDAGIREAKEEVGVVILPENLIMCGSMHRKSDDERIDYFGYVRIWENEPINLEKNKCDDLCWAKWDEIPNNTIPYIKEAILKTFTQPYFLWYEEFGWNTYHGLEEVRQNNILAKRGIINSEKNLNIVYNDIVESIRKVDHGLELDSKNDEWIDSFNKLIHEHKILIGTPILRNLNPASNCELSACSIVKTPINRNRQIVLHELETLLSSQLSKGMGIGIDLSSVAEPDKEVDRIDKILFRLDEKQKEERKRPVAVMLTLSDQHPRIKEFIRCRDHKDFKKTRLNTSVLINNINDAENRDIVHDVAESIYLSGEPGVLFSDQFNKDNDTPQWQYICTAPCAEVAMADKDACHFSYLNLAAFVDLKKPCGIERFDEDSFIQSIHVIVRFLDDIVEYSIEHSSTDMHELIQKKRRIGVGIAGFATALIKMGIPYDPAPYGPDTEEIDSCDTDEGLKFAKRITQLLQYHTKLESVKLAKRRGPFPAIKESKYSDKAWLEDKFTFLDPSEQERLISQILDYGIRNSTTVAFPPTGTSSQIAGVSPSFEPYLDFAVAYDGHKFIPKEICNYIHKDYPQDKYGTLIAQLLRNEIDLIENKEFVTATKVRVNRQLKYTQIFQNASDGSASKTIILPENKKASDIESCLLKAQLMGLKGVSIYRDKSQFRQDKDEC